MLFATDNILAWGEADVVFGLKLSRNFSSWVLIRSAEPIGLRGYLKHSAVERLSSTTQKVMFGAEYRREKSRTSLYLSAGVVIGN